MLLNIMHLFKSMRDLVKLADSIAKKIRKRVLNEDRKKFGEYVGMGADGTETSYIDKVAEDIAIKMVGKKANILSEEAGFIDNGKEYTMVIDPIDGTKNAINGIPFYGVSIAIGKERISDIEYGIVINIPSGDIYNAKKGEGAYLNGKRIRAKKKPIYILSLGKSGNEKTWKMVSRDTIRAMGAAAVEMCLVASGAASLYFMPRDVLRVTDLAASTLIVREAGGFVYDAHGSILDMHFNLEERSGVIAVSNAEMVGDLI